MPYKKERMEKAIEREIGNIILSDIKDERIKYVTIIDVHLTNDLSIATILYRVLGKGNQIDSSSKALEEAKGFIRSYLAKKINARKVPELVFKYDTSVEKADRIEEIIKGIKESN